MSYDSTRRRTSTRRDEQEAEPKAFQVSAKKVMDDTQKKTLELEGALAALRAEYSTSAHGGDNSSQTNAKGTEEHRQEGGSSRRSSPFKKKSKRWDLRREN